MDKFCNLFLFYYFETVMTSVYQVRVDVTGEETQKAFDLVLTNLARTAPPIPGFRRTKGGKILTSALVICRCDLTLSYFYVTRALSFAYFISLVMAA